MFHFKSKITNLTPANTKSIISSLKRIYANLIRDIRQTKLQIKAKLTKNDIEFPFFQNLNQIDEFEHSKVLVIIE